MGQLLNLPASNAAIWKRRGWAKDPDEGAKLETATREAPENASARTGRARPKYTGHGWWQLPGGRKVRGSKDADPQDILEEHSGGTEE